MRVAAAVIRKESGFWMVRRGPTLKEPGMWEFPGGKIEPGETAESALRRELQEELGIDVRVGALLAAAELRGIQLQAYAVEVEQGTPQLREHDAEAVIGWDQLPAYPMTELERLIVAQLTP